MHDHPSSETTFAVATLGCKVNQADSEAIGEQLSAAGFVQRDFSKVADIYIVNTCTVTHLGDRSSRQMISQARRRHPDAFLVVTGCYAELNPNAVAALPGVDLVVGNSGKDSLVEAIKQRWEPETSDSNQFEEDQSLALPDLEEDPQPDNPARLSPFVEAEANHANRHLSRTRVQMKVQDGCNNRCTYCIVPYVRGKSRSRSIESVVEHVRRKVRAGFQEIVLTGIHLGDYHPDGDEQRNLGDLIAALLRDTDIPRIRVSSLEPEDFRLEWLESWDNPRMCRHLHLPMQSGSDT